MKCILCDQEKELIDSHIISKFIRKRLTGVDTGKSTVFKYRYFDQPKPFSQDLPTENLMCGACDSCMGNKIEKRAAELMIPKGDLSIPETWESMNMRIRKLTFVPSKGPINDPFKVWSFQIENDVDDLILKRFAVLTAWRALHEMSRNGKQEVVDFLASDDGNVLNKKTIVFLESGDVAESAFFPYFATFDFLGPLSAVGITGKDDEMPFVWSFIKLGEQSAVAVMLGYWVIVWPLLPDGDSRRNFREVLKFTFVDWHAIVAQQFRDSNNPVIK